MRDSRIQQTRHGDDHVVSLASIDQRRGTLEMYLWVALASLVPVYRYVTGIGLSYLPLVILVGLLISALVGHADWGRVSKIWAVSAFLIFFAALFSGLSTSFADALQVGLPFALLIVLAPAVLVYNARTFPNFLAQSVRAFLSIQTLSAFAGLLQLAGIFISSREFKGRATGLADHPNVLGLMSSVAILICVGQIARPNARHRVLCAGVLILNASALIVSGSLSSMMALLCGFAIMFLATKNIGRILFPTAIGSVTVLSVLGLAGFDPFRIFEPISRRIAVVIGREEGVASLDIRQETYRFALSSIPKYPLTGVGMDSLNEGTYNGITVVHNYLLRAFYQGGVLLFAAMLIISVYGICLIFRSVTNRENAIAASVIGGVLTYALTSAFYNQQQYWFLIFFCVAAMQASRSIQGRDDIPEATKYGFMPSHMRC